MDFDDNVSVSDENLNEGNAQNFFGQLDQDVVSPDYVQKMDAVLFVIDCKKHIFQKHENNEAQIQVLLQSLQSFMKTKIISNTYDQVGLILYNVKNAENPLKFEGINKVYNLDNPTAKQIREVVEIENQFNEKYGFADKETPLNEVIWTCSSEFKNLDKLKYDFRIFLFTSDDNPHSDNQQLRDQTIHQFKQLNDLEVDLELFPLEKETNTKFDIRKFYQDVLQINLDEINDAVMDTSEKIMEIQKRLRQREFKKRALNKILFYIGENQKIAVKIYCHLNKAKKPTAKKLHKESNKPLKKTVKQLCSETGQTLYDEQIGSYYEVGKEKVLVNKEDIQTLKQFDTSSMKLMGFKSRNKIKLYHNYRTSYFIYPDDYRIKGSSSFFSSLINQLIIKDKVAIVRFIPRQGSQVRFCALLPQQESYDENRFQQPPGFNLIYLPYADDLRSLKKKVPQKHIETSKDLIDVAKLLVTTLNLKEFDTRNFEDPSLQKFFSHLQAHALEEELPEPVNDLLEPKYQDFEGREEIIEMFNNQLKIELNENPSENDTGLKKQTNKGKKVKQEQGMQIIKKEENDQKINIKVNKSKQKMSDDDNDISQITENELNQIKANEVEQNIISGDFIRLKVKDLQFFLQFYKLKTEGKKEDLINRALQFIADGKNKNDI